MIEDSINHAAEAEERLAYQYSQATKLIATIKAFADRTQNIEDALLQITTISDIDLSAGVNLDVIGDIVGISRIVPGADPLPFFGFDDTPAGQVYGDSDTPTSGWRFVEDGEKMFKDWYLIDTTYRTMLKARVVRNQAQGHLNDVVLTLKAIFPNDVVFVTEAENDTAIYVGINRPATAQEVLLMTYPVILPKPACVRVEFRDYRTLTNFFGFDPTGETFGDPAFPTRGGPLAEEIY